LNRSEAAESESEDELDEVVGQAFQDQEDLKNFWRGVELGIHSFDHSSPHGDAAVALHEQHLHEKVTILCCLQFFLFSLTYFFLYSI
jgi:peptidoglycan/xylan/chitin deacetylase (PgdA/CDA1 family)